MDLKHAAFWEILIPSISTVLSMVPQNVHCFEADILQQPSAEFLIQCVRKGAPCYWFVFILFSCIICFGLVQNSYFILCPHQEIITEILSKGKPAHYKVIFCDISNQRKSCLQQNESSSLSIKLLSLEILNKYRRGMSGNSSAFYTKLSPRCPPCFLFMPVFGLSALNQKLQ